MASKGKLCGSEAMVFTIGVFHGSCGREMVANTYV
jgi:hypothetical protein